MIASDKVKKFITFFEGRYKTAYKDSAGIVTAGIGHTKGVEYHKTYSDEQIDEWFEQDIKDAEMRVNRVLKVRVSQSEWDALVSQAFNLRSFEKLCNYLNKDKQLYKDKLLLYFYDVKGHAEKGLKIRRISERLLFEGREWIDFAKWARNPDIKLDKILLKEKELFPQKPIELADANPRGLDKIV